MNELSLMIKNLLDMECEHIYKGYISKEKAKKAIEAFILNFVAEGNTVDIRRANQMIQYWAKWCSLYLDNVEIKNTKNRGIKV